MFFNKKKTIISNPDEIVINYMEHQDQHYISQIMKADTDKLVTVLNQFDIKRVCSLLFLLPKEKSLQIFRKFNSSRQRAIIKSLPSDSAAIFAKETIAIF